PVRSCSDRGSRRGDGWPRRLRTRRGRTHTRSDGPGVCWSQCRPNDTTTEKAPRGSDEVGDSDSSLRFARRPPWNHKAAGETPSGPDGTVFKPTGRTAATPGQIEVRRHGTSIRLKPPIERERPDVHDSF